MSKNECENLEVTIETLPTDTSSWIYLLRQVYVSSGPWCMVFVLGLCFGAPTVLVPQIRAEANNTHAVSIEMESWLTSIHGYSSIPFIFLLPALAQLFGRKISFIIVTLNTIACFTIFYWSTNTTHLLLSEIFQGMLLASNINVLLLVMVEYSSPQYRGLFVAIESTLFYCGIWVANAVGTFSHWRNIGLIAFACCGYSLSAIFWPESPSWLAMKQRYEECAKAHHWLKGYSPESINELNSLINSQKEYREKTQAVTPKNYTEKFRFVVQLCRNRAFYQPLMLCFALTALYQFSGKMVCTMYAVTLIKQITKDEFMSYIGMLILEGVTIFGMQFGCFLSTRIKRRTLLLLFSFIGIMFLFIISLYLYMIHLGMFSENKYLSISLLTVFSVSISVGPMVVTCTLFGELTLLQYKSTSLLVVTLVSEILMATLLKLAPYIFQSLAIYGAFLFYAVSATIFAVILFKYLPETKDKTLNEIEEYFIDSSRNRDDDSKLISVPNQL